MFNGSYFIMHQKVISSKFLKKLKKILPIDFFFYELGGKGAFSS